MKMLESIGMKDLRGKHAVVIGRSNIVGKPMAMMLLQTNATVTITHSGTADLAAMTRQADIDRRRRGQAQRADRRHGQTRRRGHRRGHEPQ